VRKEKKEQIKIKYQFFKNEKPFGKPFNLSYIDSFKEIKKFIKEEKPEYFLLEEMSKVKITNSFDIDLYLPKKKERKKKKKKNTSFFQS
jgi:hypothetical protein